MLNCCLALDIFYNFLTFFESFVLCWNVRYFAVIIFRFWVPGPLGNFIMDLKYARGFIQLQDLIDRAIMRLKQKELGLQAKMDIDTVGVYTQQFPYPCFVREK